MIRSLTPTQLVVDMMLAAFFGVVVVSNELFGGLGPTRQDTLWGIAVALIMTGALAVRRWSPAISLAAAWCGAIVQMLPGLSPRLSDIAIFAVLYVTAAYGTRLVFWLGFASSLVGALVITLYLTFGPFLGGGGISWSSIPSALAVLVAAGFALLLSWTVGALVRTAIRARQNRAAQVRAESEAIAEQERVRIARDMHDVVAHSLAVVIAQADGARYAIAGAGPDAATTALSTISTTARSALADVRLLLTRLRHSEESGPQPTLADLEGLYADVRAAGLDVAVDVDPAPRTEPGAGVQLAVFRILQEALTNALRHGDGSRVDVALAWHADRVDIEVRNRVDPAARVPVAGSTAAHGHGLIGMTERAQLAGGRLGAGEQNGVFVVRASVPIENAS
ncbi:MAG TPA: histidine kinase [Microbacterium sp.]|uniref:sensor histidine kinase n=1 Tax=Microbacterium sp. TaxID=51671 RepID=UPI002BF4DA48|nr:histidine kinase [Microbacterium sp.]HWI32597.1 histidine kinase [Microbacterium sp.]